MSATLSNTSSRRSQKSTCRRCNRTVIVVTIDGKIVECDPEMINVVPFDGAPVFVFARRAHADLCESYQRAAAKAKLKIEAKAFAKARK